MGPTLKAVKESKIDCPLFCCGLRETPLSFSFLVGLQQQHLLPEPSVASTLAPQSSPQAHSDCKSLGCAPQPLLPSLPPLCDTGFVATKLVTGLERPLQVMIPLLWNS